MSALTIVLGNKCYSSWSLRGWLALKHTGAAFAEEVIALDRPDTRERIAARSPSGRVPVLEVEGGPRVWDSLAIAEYLAERFPAAGLWPADADARAVARAVSAEMHAGFAALRRHLPMDLRRHGDAELGARRRREAGVAADIERVVAIWHDCRTRFGGDGDFLFGAFCAADAAFAPVATRFVSYAVPLPPVAAAYRDAIMAWPAMREWLAAAQDEPWVIANP